MASPLPPAILLMGPTASGKTAVALALADRFPVALISVDSAQVYRDMDIGTAKPDAATLARHPHRLIDLISPEESYSAARFRADALAAMADISASGRVPLLVGGTMLYFRALIQGLAELPPADAVVRAALDAEAAERGWPALHAELALCDPGTAARLAPRDGQRIQRALEVFRVSGRPLSDWHAQTTGIPLPWRLLSLSLRADDRSELHARIARRFDAMLLAGLEDELTRLRARYTLSVDLPSMRSVGYRQVWEAQDGLIPRQEMRDRGIYATRQLAKRQMTWLSNSFACETFDCLAPDLIDRIARRTEAFLADQARC